MPHPRRMKILVVVPCFVVLFIALLRFIFIDPDKVIDDYDIDFTPITFLPNATLDILILVVLNSDSDPTEYTFSLKTLECYARVQNYSLKIVRDAEFSVECNQEDYMFKRHCITAQFLPSFDWVLFLDADISVVNPIQRLEEYIDLSSSETQLIMYDRFDGFEVAMGSYLARNSEWTKNFLMDFADYENRLPESFHGTDNGAIHAFMLDELVPEARDVADLCFKIWERSTGFEDLFLYEACIRHHMGSSTNFGPLRIVPKGRGWVRDGWITKSKWSEDRDFMLHGYKMSDNRIRTGISLLDSFLALFSHRFIWYSFLREDKPTDKECEWNYVDELKVDKKTIEDDLKERYIQVERRRFRTLARLSFQ